ncbi:phosphotransacetylase [Synechocystis sp. LKSZ1]
MLGILDLILKKTTKIAYFRPIIQDPPPGQRDKNIDLVLQYFQLNQCYEESFGLHHCEVAALAAEDHTDAIFDRIIAKYKALEARGDFILCEGSDYAGEENAFEFNLNTAIAKALNCPILLLGNGEDNTLEDTLHPIDLALKTYEEHACQVMGVIINKVQSDLVESVKTTLQKHYGDRPYLLNVLPFDPILSSPRLSEIAKKLDAEVLSGHDRLNNLVTHYLVVAMQIAHALDWLKDDNTLLITPGDRGDVILGAIQANQAINFPSIAGIVLTTGFRPEASLMRLIEGLPSAPPILLVPTHTFDTAARLGKIHTILTIEDKEKLERSIRLFEDCIDTAKLENNIKTLQVQGITPKLFIYNLVQTAKAQQRHIVLPEGHDPRILRASASLIDQEIVKITLLGQRSRIEQTLKKENIALDLDQVQVINPINSEHFEQYAQTFYELRRSKGVTLDMAQDNLADIAYFGTMMVYLGHADGMVSGAINTTQHTIRPALQIIKTKPGFSLVSSVFFMCLSDRVLVYGDCAVNPLPTAEQLAEIALTSAETAQTFGIIPRVAMLSYSSGDSGKGEEVEKVRRATQIAKERAPHLAIEGPIQYDAAVDPSVAAQKMPGSQVAGQATVFVFPDLNTGNNTYKAVQRETKAIAMGPILQGLKKPVNDLSRGCTVEDIINTVVITAIQAGRTESVV